MPDIIEQETIQQRLHQVNEALDSGMFVYVRRLLQDMTAYDLALFLESSPAKSRPVLWQLIDVEHHGEVLEELNEEVRKGILQSMRPEKLAAVAEGMDVDDLAEVLRTLPDRVYQEVLNSMDSQDRSRVETALSYDEDTAGGVMDTETVTVRADVSLDVVLRYLRRQETLPSHTDNIIVVNRYDRYLGILPLSTMLTNQPEALVVDVMETKQQPIKADTASQQVARLFEDRNLISAPVVDENHKLLGRITIDDVVDIIREEAEHSVMSMAGLDDDEDLFAPVVISARRRAVWLGTNLMTALLAAWVISQFETTLESTVALAILMGVIPSMGGVAGTQTLTLVIRGFALGQLGKSNMQSLLTKEILVSLMNGITWALVIFAIATFAFGNFGIGVVIGLAMIINLLAASSSGVFLPIIMRRFNIDPALAGGVVLTTITDIVGFAAVLGLATLLLPLL